MRKIIATIAASAAFIAADGGTADIAEAHRQTAAGQYCAEDMPCFNWATMGNHRRGIVTKNGTKLVVSVCRFKKLMNSGMIDYRTSDVMRGDFTAMRTRCPQPLNYHHF